MDNSRDKIHILGAVSDTFQEVQHPCSILKYKVYFVTTDTFYCKYLTASFTGLKKFPTERQLPLECHFNHIDWDLGNNFKVKEGVFYTFDIIAPLPRCTPRTIVTQEGSISYKLTVKLYTEDDCRMPKSANVPVIVPFTLNPDRIPESQHIRYGAPLNDACFTSLSMKSSKYSFLTAFFKYPQQCYKGPGCVCPLLIDLESEDADVLSSTPGSAGTDDPHIDPIAINSQDSQFIFQDRLPRLSNDCDMKGRSSLSRTSSPVVEKKLKRYYIRVLLVQSITFFLFNDAFRNSITVLFEDGKWSPPIVPGLHSRVEFTIPVNDLIHGSCTENPHLLVRHSIYVSIHSREPSSLSRKLAPPFLRTHKAKSNSLFSMKRPSSSSSSLSGSWHGDTENSVKQSLASPSEASLPNLSKYSRKNAKKLNEWLDSLDFKLPIYLFHRKLESELSHLPPYSPYRDSYFYLEDDDGDADTPSTASLDYFSNISPPDFLNKA
ncbi:hypothetical protein POMI540_3699 [Schizosaccharomyces pombe]